MEPDKLYYIIISILVGEYFLSLFLDVMNRRHFAKEIPETVATFMPVEEYKKAHEYHGVNFKFSLLTGGFSLLTTLLFLMVGGFGWLDHLVQDWFESRILQGIVFFGLIQMASMILNLPFSLYKTFVIEEQFGFNKMTPKLFATDLVKGLLMGTIIGGIMLSITIWLIENLGNQFWIYLWGIATLFTLIINMFYTWWIVPLFNKQTPLEEGSLKNAIATYANQQGFTLEKIFVLDGSKRSTKANAYFSGFGKTKQVTLFDTLIDELSEDEIVAVLAHEVGHYKKKHILYNLGSTVVLIGLTLFLLSIFVTRPEISLALQADRTSIHMGLIGFFILYSPVSLLTGLVMNVLSRRFEFQADNFAKSTYAAKPMITALKKLSTQSLSNPVPHPWYAFFYYSHPPMIDRLKNLNK